MALQSVTNINVDFYDKKYILLNAKQHDKNSRFLSVTCYNHGELYSINSGEHAAYIRYKKSDENSVFNHCEINRKGNILIELTEQMLASDGICCADLVIINKGHADVNTETGEIIEIDNASILSTMTFHIDVVETATENSTIESSYEYDGLNVALQKAEAEYKEVIQLARSYAIGNADDIRENEDYDNAKYYYEQSKISADNAKDSEDAAYTYMGLANDYMKDAETYKNDANTYMNNAEIYMNSALESKNAAKTSEDNAKTSEDNAAISEDNAKTSEGNAKISEDNASASKDAAKISENNAADSEANALASANKAQSYAVGGTGTRVGEDSDNSYYYYEKIINIVNGLESGFIPMGTISFSELANVEKATGYVYNISDDFVTNETFREGSGMSYTAGTNVYYTANGEWDCFGGASSPTATVDEIKSYLGI